jgi:serine/threonine protein kinase
MRLEGEKLGHYQLTRFIQGGGMGEVYLAQDLTLSRQVAIKVMKTEPVLYPDAQSSKDAARLFQREMKAISMLDHPHILTLHEAGEQLINQENITYMVMPYCPEGSLADWIRRHRSTQPLSPNEVAQILQQAADALQYAHDQHILHLDIKPANFLVRRQTEPSQLPNLLLADFGVAKIATTSKLSATPRGTFDYMAPEQLAGTSVAASDQYALGIMVYELLTGRTPYHGALPHVIPYMRNKVDPEPPSTVNPSLPSALDRIVLRALAKKPQDRFASVKEFASAFAGALKLNATQHSEVKTTLEQTTQERLPKYAVGANPSKKVSNRPTVPDTKRPPRKYGSLWAVGIGVVAVGISIVPIELGVRFNLTLLIFSSLWIAGLATGKITRQRRLGWIPGIILTIAILLTGSESFPDTISYGSFFYYATFPAILVMHSIPVLYDIIVYKTDDVDLYNTVRLLYHGVNIGMNSLILIITFFLIQGTICGLISFWGAAFATRKSRK